MKNLLHEFAIGEPAVQNLQTIDDDGHIRGNVMAYWPLIGPPVHGVGFWGDFVLDQDVAYNRLRFRSTYAGGPCVIPQGTLLVGKGAQARTVPGAEVFEHVTTVSANCVEPGAPGLFDPHRTQPAFMMLPVGLRLEAHRLRGVGRTETLWPAIHRYNWESRVPANDVPRLMDAMWARIEHAAPPRTVSGQRGVAVTLNSALVGVEVAPTPAHFVRWWRDGLAHSYAVEGVRKARPRRLGSGCIEDVVLEPNLGLNGTPDRRVMDIEQDGVRGQAVFVGGRLAYATVLGEEVF